MKFFFKRIVLITSGGIGLLIIVSVSFVILYKFINPPVTPLMVIRYFETNSKKKTVEREWKNIEEISPYALLAVIASEDQKFFYHFGFDMEEIAKAVVKKTNKIRGASTISQQVAKNVFLWPSRTWLRKGLEAYFTLLIELLWSKKRILEVYMNVIETGKNIYGIEAASQRYFKKPSSHLRGSESAIIATALPNPLKRNPARPSLYMIRRKNWIIRQINNLGGKAFIRKNLPYVQFKYPRKRYK